jgi:hypothetical protein
MRAGALWFASTVGRVCCLRMQLIATLLLLARQIPSGRGTKHWWFENRRAMALMNRSTLLPNLCTLVQ